MGYEFTDFAKLRVPDEDAGDDVPADLSALAADLDDVVVLEAPTIGDRDSLYLEAPSGVLCRIRAATAPYAVSGLYVKTGDVGVATWGTVWEPPADLTLTAIQLADPVTTRGTPQYDPGIYPEPGGVFATMHGAVVRVDGTKLTQGTLLGYTPSNFLPMFSAGDYPCATSYSSLNSGTNCKISILVDGSLFYYGPDVNWVGFDGLRYFIAQN